ncbi:MAG TPA: CBS domain-containing protein [Chromatiaceae bacterium]|nr:CBS domain-containing protein [Chromatiaceae bacterium]
MQTVRQVLQGKGREVATIGPERSVYDAMALMAEKGIGALVVTQGPAVVGLISERDYARNVALKGRNSRETPVGDIMTSRVACVGPDQTVQECMTIMTEMRVRHLPVMEGETLAGLVSIGDLVKAIIEEQEALIEHLVRYING